MNGINVDGTQNMFILTILEKIKDTRLKLSQGRVTDCKLSRKRELN